MSEKNLVGKLPLEKLQQWRNETKDYFRPWKQRMKKARDAYHGDQWNEQDKYDLEVLQRRAALTHNFIAPTVNLLVGIERRNRLDTRVFARGPGDVKKAETLTKVVKYVRDQNNSDMAISQAFEDAVLGGAGFLEIQYQEEDPDREAIEICREDPYIMYWDWRATRWDLSDARYLFREKWLAREVAAEMFPEFTEQFQTMVSGDEDPIRPWQRTPDLPSANVYGHYGNVPEWDQDGNNDYYDSKQDLIALTECYYMRRESMDMLIAKGSREGMPFDPTNPEHLDRLMLRDEMGEPVFRVVRQKIRVIYLCVFAGDTEIYHEKLSYKHRLYPFIPVWWRKKDNGEPRGVVADLLDPQDELNKQLSKALDILVSEQAIVEKGAVKNIKDFAKQMANPRGVIEVEPGAVRGGKIQIRDKDTRVPQHLQLAELLVNEIRNVAGTPRERLGAGPAQAASAVAMKIEQGDLITAFGFDNLRIALERAGEYIVSLAQQFYEPGMFIRITEDPRSPEYVQLGMDEETSIFQGRFDVKIDAAAATPTFRQAVMAQVLEMANNKGLPLQVVLLLLKTAFDNSDIPDRQAMVGTLEAMFQQSVQGILQPPNLPENQGGQGAMGAVPPEVAAQAIPPQ